MDWRKDFDGSWELYTGNGRHAGFGVYWDPHKGVWETGTIYYQDMPHPRPEFESVEEAKAWTLTMATLIRSNYNHDTD